MYSYKYPGYSFLHSYAGIIYNPCKKINISLTSGPGLGLYDGNTQFNLGINLSGNYHLSDKFSISPVLIFMKETKSDPLWATGFRATIVF